MSGGGKKFNIWIAYSDLFTNLSTFLFFASLGLFAALAGGRSAPDSQQPTCRVAEAAAADLLRQPSFVTDIREGGTQPECVRYYGLSTYRFRSADAHLRNLSNADGRALSEPEIVTHICQPIWRLIARRDFRANNGRLTLRGIAALENDWLTEPPCDPRREEEPRVRHDHMPRGESIGRIRACQINPRRSFPEACPDVLRCLRWDVNDRPDWCQDMFAVIEWDRRRRLSCHARATREQARTLFDICQSAPTSGGGFVNRAFNNGDYVDEARIDEQRPGLWERVGYDSHSKRPSDDTSTTGQRQPLDALAAGAVVLEVQYQR